MYIKTKTKKEKLTISLKWLVSIVVNVKKTADYRTFKVIMLPFSSLNCKQANWSVTGIFSIT